MVGAVMVTLAGVPLGQYVLEIGSFCEPYTTVEDTEAARRYLRDVWLFMIAGQFGPSAFKLWDEYLRGGEPDSERRSLGPDGIGAFRNDSRTREALKRVVELGVAEIQRRSVELGPPGNPYAFNVAELQKPADGTIMGPTRADAAPDGFEVDITYRNPLLLTGNLAGGVGGWSFDTPPSRDYRVFNGTLSLVPQVTDRGVLTGVDVLADTKLTVLESIDFCPGDPGGPPETMFTIPASRLEATGDFQPNSEFKYAKPLIWELTTNLDRTITRVEQPWKDSNDPDRDGSPNTQPWPGGAYAIDNCLDKPNPDQVDKDYDGLGDACDPKVDDVRWELYAHSGLENSDCLRFRVGEHASDGPVPLTVIWMPNGCAYQQLVGLRVWPLQPGEAEPRSQDPIFGHNGLMAEPIDLTLPGPGRYFVVAGSMDHGTVGYLTIGS